MELLIEIENGFKDMIKTGKVDLSILNPLKEFRTKLVESKKNILSSKMDIYDSFPIFHAIETQLRVIDQMLYRVSSASEIHDNPKVAEDALVIIPPFRSVHDSLITEIRDSHYMMGLSSRLQISAMKNDMYPSPEQITKLINKEILNDSFGRFVGRVGEEIERI